MNNYPEYVEINNKKYKINTDFRVAIKCNEVAQDDTIGDFERSLAIIYLLYGDEGLNHNEDYEKLILLAKKYLSCGKEITDNSKEKPDMDYVEDMDYIEASFMSDYHIDLCNTQMHWWKFYNLMNGLSNSELGNCCVLNRIRNLRNLDEKEIKDSKERQKIIKAKKQVELKKYNKEVSLTKEQKESMERFNAIVGI
jgi:hypothetical protein